MSGRAALGALLLGTGVLWLLSALELLDLSYRAWIGVLLVAIGVALVLTRGRRSPLVAAGILVALAGAPSVFVESHVFDGGLGEAVERPTTAAELGPFRHAVGKLTVDLTASGLDLDEATVEASVGIGELVVVVPEDTDVSLVAHVGVGNADWLGEESESGVDVDLRRISGTSGRQELALELDVGVGSLRVRRG